MFLQNLYNDFDSIMSQIKGDDFEYLPSGYANKKCHWNVKSNPNTLSYVFLSLKLNVKKGSGIYQHLPDRKRSSDIFPFLVADNQKYANSVIKFQELDLTQGEIPEADLLITRDVIGHLTLEDGKKVIANILKSKCKYLLTTTWYNPTDENYFQTHTNPDREVTLDRQWEAGAAQFYPVCLHSEPFNLPKPEFYIEEKPVVDGYENGVRKGLAFYDLDKLIRKLEINTINPFEIYQFFLVPGLYNRVNVLFYPYNYITYPTFLTSFTENSYFYFNTL
jgi:hypothetical protein